MGNDKLKKQKKPLEKAIELSCVYSEYVFLTKSREIINNKNNFLLIRA